MWRKRKPSSPASCARSGLISSFRTSAARRGVTWVSSGASAWTAPRWKISPSIAPRSSTLRSARLELVEARREQRLQRGRDHDVAVRLAGHRQHLLDEERVAAGGAGDPLAQLVADVLGDQLLDVVGAQRLEPERHRPGGVALDELRAGDAEQQDRRARGEQRDVLDQIAERLLAPLDVVQNDDKRSLRRSLLQRLAKGPGDLLGRRRRLALAEQRADRRRGVLVRGQLVELLQHLDDRPVRDPFAVGEAAAADDGRLDRGQELRGEPRLADTGVADDRHELATRSTRVRSAAARISASSCSRPTNRASCRRSGASSTRRSR